MGWGEHHESRPQEDLGEKGFQASQIDWMADVRIVRLFAGFNPNLGSWGVYDFQNFKQV